MNLYERVFLSTPSGWRATNTALRLSEPVEFLSTPSGWRATCFPAPLGKCTSLFLSTPSGWRATKGNSVCKRGDAISIHALRVEGDHGEKSTTFYVVYFYPRPPGGGRRFSFQPYKGAIVISIHALRVEGDRRTRQTCPQCQDFYPRPPGGGRRTAL